MTDSLGIQVRVAPRFREHLEEVKKDVKEYLKKNNMKISQKRFSDRIMTGIITKHKHWKNIMKDLKQYFMEGKDEE